MQGVCVFGECESLLVSVCVLLCVEHAHMFVCMSVCINLVCICGLVIVFVWLTFCLCIIECVHSCGQVC